MIKELKAFEKIHLHPGELKTVVIEIPVQDCATNDVEGKQWMVEKRNYTVLVGASSSDIKLRGTFSVT